MRAPNNPHAPRDAETIPHSFRPQAHDLGLLPSQKPQKASPRISKTSLIKSLKSAPRVSETSPEEPHQSRGRLASQAAGVLRLLLAGTLRPQGRAHGAVHAGARLDQAGAGVLAVHDLRARDDIADPSLRGTGELSETLRILICGLSRVR
jgi:hypothetical protein